MESSIKLAIADPNTLFREGLKRLLYDSQDFLVVGEAVNDVETLNLVEEAKPDVLLLDRVIPKLEAVPILLAIKEQDLPTKVLILSLLPDEAAILNCARAGARGYLLKSAPFAMLVDAMREVSRERIWVDRQTGFADAFALLAQRARNNSELGEEINPVDVLSKRELQILQYIARGTTNDDIAKKLSISPRTVKTHASKIFNKLNVKNRTQAALLAMQARSRNGQDYFAHLPRNA